MKVIAVLWTVCLVGLCHGGCSCLGKSKSELKETSYALDLSNVDINKVTVSSGKSGNVSYRIYETDVYSKIISVSDGKTEIWKAKEGETCKTVSESTTLIPKILAICIGKDGEVNLECFEKVGEEWKSITEKVYK